MGRWRVRCRGNLLKATDASGGADANKDPGGWAGRAQAFLGLLGKDGPGGKSEANHATVGLCRGWDVVSSLQGRGGQDSLTKRLKSKPSLIGDFWQQTSLGKAG